MPAAAVIPAPIAYIKLVAVKKLVVGSQAQAGGPAWCRFYCPTASPPPAWGTVRGRGLAVLTCAVQQSALSRAVLFAERPGWPARLL